MKAYRYELLELDEATAMHWLMPLHFFYARRQTAMPAVAFIDGDSMPDPECGLLVHDVDMTSTLSLFHQAKLALRVLDSERSDDYLLRLVALETRNGGTPVEFGAIGIRLEALAPAVKQLVLEGEEPLGGILADYDTEFSSEPRGFFAIEADEMIAEDLGEPVGTELFGRCNKLMDEDGIVFADIVEILPENGGTESVFRT